MLFLLMGVAVAGTAQTSTDNKAEKRNPAHSEKKIKARKPMAHFDQPATDKNIKHNGTDVYKKMHQTSYVVDGDGFGIAGSSGGRRKHHLFRKKRKHTCGAIAGR